MGRLSREKHVDVIVKACEELGERLIVVGTGKEMKNLCSAASCATTFLGEISDEELAELYRNCQAFIFCGEEEDFGMVVVEAQMYGKPVIALNQGGVKETVVDGVTGILFNNPTVEDLKKAIHRFMIYELTRLPARFAKAKARRARQGFKNKEIKDHARKFSAANFRARIQQHVQQLVKSL